MINNEHKEGKLLIDKAQSKKKFLSEASAKALTLQPQLLVILCELFGSLERTKQLWLIKYCSYIEE